MLAVGKNQNIVIKGDADGSNLLKITGSEDTAKLVALESEKENWLKAIEQDKRTWTNVSTFQEFETPVAFDFAVTSLPANALIDNSGKVIAKNLHGNNLKAAVEKLFSSEK